MGQVTRRQHMICFGFFLFVFSSFTNSGYQFAFCQHTRSRQPPKVDESSAIDQVNFVPEIRSRRAFLPNIILRLQQGHKRGQIRKMLASSAFTLDISHISLPLVVIGLSRRHRRLVYVVIITPVRTEWNAPTVSSSSIQLVA